MSPSIEFFTRRTDSGHIMADFMDTKGEYRKPQFFEKKIAAFI